jgi:DNA-binding winged helix-turn-helix (wHTH) protein
MVYRFQAFQIDPANSTLCRDGEEIPVRRKAFQVLVALIERRDRLVPKEELFAAVWPDTAVTDDVLAGVISELRKALGDNPKSPAFIKTVSRAGYRFIGDMETAEPVAAPEAAAPAASRRTARVWTVAALMIAGAGVGIAWRATHAQPADIDPQEVAWWRFDEASGDRVVDSSGRSPGQLFGGIARVAGKSGTALSFDGRTGYVAGIDSAHTLPSLDVSRSLSAWLRCNSTNGDTTQIFLYGDSALPRGFPPDTRSSFNVAMRMDGTLAMGMDIAGLGLHGRTRLDDGRWHHIAAGWTGPSAASEGHLYVDGREEASGKLRPLATVAGAHWWMGGLPNATLFRGELDDVRVFNTSLSRSQASGLYRCSSGTADLEIAGRPYYFLPIWGGAEILEGEIRNPGNDVGGVQFAQGDGVCSLDSIRGSDAGQDLRIAVDLLVPTDSAGHVSEAGPYFRSRRAAPGDGLIGGTSAGFWVVLFSNGAISVQRLNPSAVVAFSTIRGFDATIFHHLEMVAVGERLQVAVDGNPIRFDQGGQQTYTVAIPPLWDGPPRIGYNRGTAGIAFWARQNRGAIGGQSARNLQIERAAALPRP